MRSALALAVAMTAACAVPRAGVLGVTAKASSGLEPLRADWDAYASALLAKDWTTAYPFFARQDEWSPAEFTRQMESYFGGRIRRLEISAVEPLEVKIAGFSGRVPDALTLSGCADAKGASPRRVAVFIVARRVSEGWRFDIPQVVAPGVDCEAEACNFIETSAGNEGRSIR